MKEILMDKVKATSEYKVVHESLSYLIGSIFVGVILFVAWLFFKWKVLLFLTTVTLLIDLLIFVVFKIRYKELEKITERIVDEC